MITKITQQREVGARPLGPQPLGSPEDTEAGEHDAHHEFERILRHLRQRAMDNEANHHHQQKCGQCPEASIKRQPARGAHCDDDKDTSTPSSSTALNAARPAK